MFPFKKTKRAEKRNLHNELVEAEKVLFDTLDALHKKYNARREGVRPPDKDRPREDFMTAQEVEEYAELARKHENVCSQLGKRSEFFIGRLHRYHKPNSPIAFLQVTGVENEQVEIKPVTGYGEEQDAKNAKKFNEIWAKDEKFEADFKQWMEDNGYKFWQNMTTAERMQSIKNRKQ